MALPFLAMPGLAAAQAPAGRAGSQVLSGGVMAMVQEKRQHARLHASGADRAWIPESKAALERFLQGRGLQAPGRVNPLTLQALGLDPNGPARGPRQATLRPLRVGSPVLRGWWGVSALPPPRILPYARRKRAAKNPSMPPSAPQRSGRVRK